MIQIPQKAPPASLVENLRLQLEAARRLADPTLLSYNQLNQAAKDELRKHLAAQQRNRCAYCERKLSRDLADTVIEHFHPRHEAIPRAWTRECELRIQVSQPKWASIEISIGNLLLCCAGGKGTNPGNASCDNKKSNQHICDVFYNPKTSSYPTLIQIEQGGTAAAFNHPADEDDATRVINETLGLNINALVSARRGIFARRLAAFSKLKSEVQGRIPAGEIRRRFAAQLREEAVSAELGSTLLSIATKIESGAR